MNTCPVNMASTPLFDPKHMAEISSGPSPLLARGAAPATRFPEFVAGPQEQGVVRLPRAAAARWTASALLQRVVAPLVHAKESVLGRYQSFRLHGKYSGSRSAFNANILKAASAGAPSALQAIGAHRLNAWARGEHPAIQRIIDAADYNAKADVQVFCKKVKEEHQAQHCQAASREFEAFMRTVVRTADAETSAFVSVTLPENVSSWKLVDAVAKAACTAVKELGYADRMKFFQAIKSDSVPNGFPHILPIIEGALEKNFAPIGDDRFEGEELLQIAKKIAALEFEVERMCELLGNAKAGGGKPAQGVDGYLDDAKKDGRALLHALMMQLNLPAMVSLGGGRMQAPGAALLLQAAEGKRIGSKRMMEEAIELATAFKSVHWLAGTSVHRSSFGHEHASFVEQISLMKFQEVGDFLKRCHSQIYDPMIESLECAREPGAPLLRDLLMAARNRLQVVKFVPDSLPNAEMREELVLREVLKERFPPPTVTDSGSEGLASFNDVKEAFASVRHLAQENGKFIRVLNKYGKMLAAQTIRSVGRRPVS